MSLVTCESCKQDLLTEADPYVVLPKPSGTILMCLKCATTSAHRDATEEVAKAHKRGWEQGKRGCEMIVEQSRLAASPFHTIRSRIAAMEYSHKEG